MFFVRELLFTWNTSFKDDVQVRRMSWADDTLVRMTPERLTLLTDKFARTVGLLKFKLSNFKTVEAKS